MKGIGLFALIVAISVCLFASNSYAEGRRVKSSCAKGTCANSAKTVERHVVKGWLWDTTPAPAPVPPAILPPPPVTPPVVSPCAPVDTCGPVDQASAGRRHVVLKAVKVAGKLAVKPLKLLPHRR
jgi:hypothetical protein